MVAKKSKKTEETDWISELPDCLLHHIFSSVDTTGIVRTCILSKRWRYFWTSSPDLNFTYDGLEQDDHSNFITQLLQHRNSIPLNSFSYSMFMLDVEASVVESWIAYAVKHQVQHLTLYLQACCLNRPIQFPNCFFGCTSLTTLIFDGNFNQAILLPKTFDLPSLKYLHLCAFHNIDARNLNPFFYGIQYFSVPSLISFDILNAEVEAPDLFSEFEFVIVAPNLRKFKFEGYPPFLCSTKNLSSLDLIEIDLPCEYELDEDQFEDEVRQDMARNVLQMLNAFHIAKSVTLSMAAIKVLSDIPTFLNEHPSLFPNLKYLEVQSNESSKNVKNLKIPNFIFDYFRKGSSLLEIIVAK
ncbi:FBD-associated F-box protein At2g26860-like [Mercurialis annua]|uniref:FBD-associated F-box protein At2g26860-like n=1 Tax=Mercurialis annua TaxID=3986 RepID=UPI00215FEBC1|nr:FBD-associated F-box protein At2g26860-like [Mercurialis annua]